MAITKREKVSNSNGSRAKAKGKQRVIESDEEKGETAASKEDGDEDAEGEADDEEGEEQVHGTKRQRINDIGDSRASTHEPERIPIVKTLPRDTDGYIPGSIVRIQLKNFVTYDYVQFRCGPYLNMILGPNGTGKSSIACAIALGLNFPPSILGRASELNSFVKLGTDSGYIEIELKGQKGKGNYSIRRNLSAKSKSSTFSINGTSVPAKEVTAKVQELNVQVSNLCSFLPQDKVSEFAAMTPQQLLRETQRAAGDERLTAWQDTLINSGKELRILQEKINEEQDHMRQLQERNAAIERDVQRFRERKRIEHDIELLNVLIPVEEYRIMRQKYINYKAEQRVWHKKVSKLKAKNAPVHEFLTKLENDSKKHEQHREKLKKSTSNKFNQMVGGWQRSEAMDAEAEDLTTKLDQLKKDEKDRQRKIKELETNIERLKAELAIPLQTENADELMNDHVKKINHERSRVEARRGDIQAELERNADACAAKTAAANIAREELKKLDDILVRKMHNMRQWDRDAHDVILWLRQNQHRFKKPILEPPAIIVNVPDKRFVDTVEACFSSAQLRTFVAQCQEDLDLFNQIINDGQGQELGRRVRVTTWFRAHREDQLVPPPMSEEELREERFDGYALQYVDCPPELHWFLKRELNLHRTAVALRPDLDVNKVMKLITRDGPNGPGAGANFFNGATINMVSRSRYGKRAVANITREIRPARNLRIVMIDPEVKRKYDQTIATAQQEMTLLDEEKKKLQAVLNEVLEEEKVFEGQMADIKKRRDAITDAHTQREKLKGKLERQEQSLVQHTNKPSVQKQRADLKKKLYDLSQKRVKDLVHTVVQEQRECARIGLEALQISANKNALKAECARKDEKYEQALLEFRRVDEAYKRVKEESKVLLDVSRDVVSKLAPDIRADYDEVENRRTEYEKARRVAEQEGTTPPASEGVDVRSLDELKEDLETQKANLELNSITNPGIIEQYERRKEEIGNLEGSVEEKQRRAGKFERSIKTARENWQPALEKLVASIGEKFSAAFDRIGCAGELRITQHEDYEKWAIDILVKFRDSEKLQVLTAQRQSGGERSLTTILYLMSLTEEARAPFSLVDEINQGMDNRAERMVHNSMVEVTCKAEAAQYFLITPKLLTDLEYHERMKILCVNNGEWLPEDRKLGNMMDMIQRYVDKQT
ncbi:hypothetical protein M378DRAFT_78988 [Amanita muscaria Koide BX008]|uniref:Structural maintenance of chromosomes protein 5 n=1 Tax=Amanita muscaria (strain Koide BX008) TaxID=946122 RepID=A0A0C2TB37_AMAMK|nr:hypothetical protein M378DRAFT_78988 [Amanita muscaria Koide BX008]